MGNVRVKIVGEWRVIHIGWCFYGRVSDVCGYTLTTYPVLNAQLCHNLST